MANDPQPIPRHIAIIMDGNGRWAKERGLPRTEGHRAGANAVKRTVEACGELGIDFLTLYAFSTENWNRPETEIKALMALLERFLKERTKEMLKQNVRLHAIGRTHLLPDSCRKQLAKSLEETKRNDGLNLILALSYGAREEITDGVQDIARRVKEGTLAPEDIDAEVISNSLYTKEFPDPDLLVRTSGELRISNFLLWQISYAEIYVTETLWPDFNKDTLVEAIRNFGARQRRFGRVG